MRLSTESLYPLVIVAVLAALTTWLEHTTREAVPVSRERDPQTPEFVTEGARMMSFDEQGQLYYTLHAKHFSHYPQLAVSRLDDVDLELRSDGRIFHSTADHADVHREGEEVFLRDNVLVWREGLDSEPDLTLEAETLTVWPRDQRAASDDPVVLRQGTSIAHGQSMRADSLFGTLELIGRARATLQP